VCAPLLCRHNPAAEAAAAAANAVGGLTHFQAGRLACQQTDRQTHTQSETDGRLIGPHALVSLCLLFNCVAGAAAKTSDKLLTE